MKLRFSPLVFMAAYCAAYVAVLATDFPAFRYYPLDGAIAWGPAPQEGHGPGMAWYGLMVNAAIAAALLALFVPQSALAWLRNRLWLFPTAALLASAYLMRIFFQ